MSRGPVLACALSLTLCADQAAADYDSRQLFRKGSWEVELVHDTDDGALWCSGRTGNRSGQSFAITGFDTGLLGLLIHDASWNIADRPVRFLVDVDYSRWTLDGTGSGASLYLVLEDTEPAARFLRELMAGSAVAVMNAEERRLAVFSLAGSSAAITRLFDCWRGILIRDPSAAADPFMSSADPF